MKVHEKQDLCHHNVWWYLLIIKRKNSNLTAEKTDTSTKWFKFNIQSSSSPVQSLSRVWLFSTPWNAAQGLPVHHQLLEFTQTHVHWAGDTIQPSHPLSSPFPPAFNLSKIRDFSGESVLCIRWPKYWSYSFSISPSNEYSGLISFRMDWLDLISVQRTLKSLFQHHSSKASILQCSASFTVQLSHPYMTTGNTIALTRWTFVGKVISLLFNMLSRLVFPTLEGFKSR